MTHRSKFCDYCVCLCGVINVGGTGIIAITSMSLSRLIAPFVATVTFGVIVRLSTFRTGDAREINTLAPTAKRASEGARQTQKLVFRKLVSVINNELSIYSTREPTRRRPSVYRGG